jgi:hypothetical protein
VRKQKHYFRLTLSISEWVGILLPLALNPKRGWMDKENGENLPHAKVKNRPIADDTL